MRTICGIWLLLTGCSSQASETCGFPGASPTLIGELYFGRAGVTEAAWESFAADTLTSRFPDGFTALDAAGQWRQAPGQPIAREASKLVIVAAPDAQTTRDNLAAVMASYRSRFGQKSVGIVLDRKCAAF